MKWEKPPRLDPLRDQYIVGEEGFLICKAITHGQPIYTLSHRGRLVFTGSLDECKRRADEDCSKEVT